MAQIKRVKSPVSKRIVHSPEACTGCGLCELMCSLYHEGEQGQALSRCTLTGDRLTAEFTFNVCKQCSSPACYDACPLQDSALCIDTDTGIKYINAEECTGCGLCMDACFIKVTDIPDVKIGDVVTIMGEDGDESISPHDIGDWIGSVSYEVMSRFGRRLPRVYKKGGQLVEVNNMLVKD